QHLGHPKSQVLSFFVLIHESVLFLSLSQRDPLNSFTLCTVLSKICFISFKSILLHLYILISSLLSVTMFIFFTNTTWTMIIQPNSFFPNYWFTTFFLPIVFSTRNSLCIFHYCFTL